MWRMAKDLASAAISQCQLRRSLCFLTRVLDFLIGRIFDSLCLNEILIFPRSSRYETDPEGAKNEGSAGWSESVGP